MIRLNDEIVKPTRFPDNTHQVWQLPPGSILVRNTIQWDFENDGELIQLAQLVDLIRGETLSSRIDLVMPYCPYGRQDKEISNTTTFGLYSFSKLINSLGLHSVTTLDVHSDVAMRYITGLANVIPMKSILFALIETEAKTILFPDKGAMARYSEHIQAHRKDLHFIAAEKVRNQLTGELDPPVLMNKRAAVAPVLIVDDICDGGRTFINLVEPLKKQFVDPSDIHLYVTHGIFSRGTAALRNGGISRIFTWRGERL